MQQHREARRALDQRADRRAAQAEDEVSFPVSRHRPIGRFGGTLADHDLGRDEALAAPACARPRHPQRPPGSQAGRQFAAQRASALNEERLIDGFVADAHRLVVREVDRQAPGNLLRAPGPGPSPILPRAMPAALPRTRPDRERRTPLGRDDDASQSLLHISAQGRVERKLASAWGDGPIARHATGRSSPDTPDPPLRVAALRRSSREIVEADRPSRRPIYVHEPARPHPERRRVAHQPAVRLGAVQRAGLRAEVHLLRSDPRPDPRSGSPDSDTVTA